jgi:PAS domain S-box-containing protein/diguanylate cyclase (GGDEF)-like protein
VAASYTLAPPMASTLNTMWSRATRSPRPPVARLGVAPHAKNKRAAEGVSDGNDECYRAVFEQAAVGIVHTSLKGKLRVVNPAFCAMSGYSHAEARQLYIRDITHPQDIDGSVEGRAALVERRAAPYQRELRLLRKDGSYLWVELTTSLVRGADSVPRHFVSVLNDISKRKRAEAETSRFRAAMNVAVDAIFLTDSATMRVVYVNDSACSRLGYSREQLLRKPSFELLGKTREELRCENDRVIAAGERGTRFESRYVRSDGSTGWTELFRKALAIESGTLIVTIARDITERRAQQERIERLSRVHAVLSGINSAIARIRDRNDLFRKSCRIAHEAGGFDVVWIGLIDEATMVAEPMIWQGREECVRHLQHAWASPGEPRQGGQSLLVEMLDTRRPVIINDAANDPRSCVGGATADVGFNSAAFLPLTLADKVVGVMAMYSPVRGHFDDDEVKLLGELAADISFALDHLEKSERAAYLALYDELTGLANRCLLGERLAQFLHAAGHTQDKLVLALLDLERLRSVNKSVGRPTGDRLLRQVGERLVRAAGAGATARVASNHFAIVLPSVRDRAEATRILATLTRACFAEPYEVDGTELKVGVKTGLAMFPHDGMDVETLLVNAEAALRKAKQSGERQVFFTANLSERTGAWLPLERQLVGALEREEFALFYQPKVDAASGRMVGLEALLRWQSRELGPVPPAKFIPLMEETGMILEVGAWALQRASLDHRRWTEMELAPPRIAVNVSAIQLRQQNFVPAVQAAIRDGLTPSGIDLELTESLVMEDVEDNIRKLREIRALGLEIAIDDFGTGFSSLGYLAKLPIQALKIDRSFIVAMMKDPAAMTLVQTIISLAHTLGIKVIAEGVEEAQQAEHLRLLHCDQIQGYLISRPVPFNEITHLMTPFGGSK